MKKLSLLIGFGIIITTLLISCSADENNKSEKDLSIGIWKPIKSADVFTDGTEEVYTFTNCEQQTRFTINETGEINLVEFYEDSNGNCVENNDNKEFISGTWEKIAGDEYKLVTTYYYPNSQQNITETIILDKVTFPNSYTMRMQKNESNNDVIDYYYAEYSRVK